MPDCDFAKEFPHRRVRDADVLARVQVLISAGRVALDDPTQAQASERERLRKITDDGGMREACSGIGFAAVIIGWKTSSETNWIPCAAAKSCNPRISSLLSVAPVGLCGELTIRIFVRSSTRRLTSSRSME